MKTKPIAFHITAHVTALKAVACMSIKQIPILTRHERLNYDANCHHHKVPNVFLSPSRSSLGETIVKEAASL